MKNGYIKPAWSLLAILLFTAGTTSSWGQRVGSKSTKYELTTVPTVPEAIVNKVSFFIYADPDFFTLEDLRRYGGNIKVIKEGERLEAMKYFSLGREVEIVDELATCLVEVALGPESYGDPVIKSEPRKSGSEVLTYWAEILHTMPVRVTLSDGEGNVFDGYEINSPNVIRYGNEKISEIESWEGGVSYSTGALKFDNEEAVKTRLKDFEGQRFVRRKAVLMQLSKVINEMEDRLFFLEARHPVEIFVGKGKHDYTELELAQAQAIAAFKSGDLSTLDGAIDTWNSWATEVDFVSKKPKVSKKLAAALHLNLAVAQLYRDEFGASGMNISKARGLAVGDAEALARCDDLQNRLMKRRRAATANPDFVIPTEEEMKREKAPDMKSIIGRRSQNKDVEMILPGDRYDDMGDLQDQWNAEAVAGSAEATASEAAEMTMAQRLGARLTPTVGGVSLSFSPLTDPDLVGQPLPAEVFDIPKLVSLNLSGMKVGALPENIDNLALLQTLIVSGNELKELPSSLANIPTLKRLIARNNALTGLPEGLELLTELKVIDLKGNPFDDGAKVRTGQRFGEGVKVKFD